MEENKDKLTVLNEKDNTLIENSHVKSPMKRKRKNKNKIIFAALIFMFLIIMAATGIYAFAGDYLMNQWRIATMSSKEYYIYIEKKSTDKKINTLVNSYSMVENVTNNYSDLASEIVSNIFNIDGGDILPKGGIYVSVKLEEELARAFGQPDLKNLDIYLKKDNITREEINGSESVTEETYNVSQLSIISNEVEAFIINYLSDGQGGSYIQKKDYIDRFIKLPEIKADTIKELLPSLTNDERDTLDDTDILPKDDTDISLEEPIKHLLEMCFYNIIENNGEAVLEKSVQFSKADDNIKCNTITVEYSFEELREAVNELLSELSYDESFYNMLTNIGIISDKAELKVYIATIRTIINAVSNAIMESGKLMMKLYVSNDGRLLYRDIVLAVQLSAVQISAEASISTGYGSGYGFDTPLFAIYNDEKQLIDLKIKAIENQEIKLDAYPNKDNCIEIENLGSLLDIPALLKFIMESEEPY